MIDFQLAERICLSENRLASLDPSHFVGPSLLW